jgi:ribonuclease D
VLGEFVRHRWVCEHLHAVGGAPSGMHVHAAAVQVLGKPLDKSIRSSDWEARPLSQEQQTYAATDAHVLVTLCQVLLGMR